MFNSLKKKPEAAQAQKTQFRAVAQNTELQEIVAYLHSPWRIVWTNFLSGILRGLGLIVGMTLVFAFALWLIAIFVDFPLIGEYVQQVQTKLKEYSEQVNYQDNFERLEQILQEQTVELKRIGQ